ncbi:hypothetical protein CCL16_02955 [Pseudomonas syringae]|uniref:Uncharacterized protein n=1 Tax=Pseudomonas syringae pv. syringae (strain B728a) TaxID=205918 RepID=Q4ZVT3_PSEU2|nr:hypothetical protein Psyr_1691 [Pseudomonas syringae pv. syringae B728a]PBP92662.1 hypothetical protein CCL16_02955 [Pseudomonas syringae]PYD17377.1 hypothetical protein DND47_07125 [Pseudomonas syringae pv. syringae]
MLLAVNQVSNVADAFKDRYTSHVRFFAGEDIVILLLSEGRRSELVREDGSSDNAFSENTCSFANKFAPTAYGQNQKRICV